MKIYKIIELSDKFNNVGITKSDDYIEGDLTIGGSSFPKDDMKDSFPSIYNNIPFKIEYENKYDNVSTDGQHIKIGSYISEIHIVGTSCPGDYLEEFVLCKDDGKRKEFKIGFSDFLSIEPCFEESLIYQSNYAHSQFGRAEHLKISMWINSIVIEEKEFIEELILPKNMFLHIFSITIKV